MRTSRQILLLLVLVLTAFPLGAQTALSGSEAKLAQAEAARKQYPKWAPAAAALGAAYVSRTRETGDPAYLQLAEAAVSESLQQEPGNIPALKVRAQIRLEQHADAEAKAIAESLQKRGPDDLEVASLLARAAYALGQYGLAEKNAQFIRDLRPAEVLGYLRGAELRYVYGDPSGSFDYWRDALIRLAPDMPEEKSYVMVQLARVMESTGNEAGAEQALRQALQVSPRYYLALEQLGRLQSRQGKHKEALSTFQQTQSPAPDWLYYHALALEKAGEAATAKEAWRQFTAASPRAPQLLARYELEITHQPTGALRLLQQEAQQRQDVETLHLLAWALYENKQAKEASAQIEKALRVGIRDAEMLYHAGLIAAACGDPAAAQQYFQQSVALNGHSPYAADARKRSGI